MAFRAFYAVPALNAPDGTPTNLITGFMNMLERLERTEKPKGETIKVNKISEKNKIKIKKTAPHSQMSLFGDGACEIEEESFCLAPVLIVFDAPCKTFRHEAFPEYKQQRKPTPLELKQQIPILAELLKFLGYPVIMIDGVEADDTIASISRAYGGSVVSSDKDLLQILRPGVEIVRPTRGVSVFDRYDENLFINEYGFEPCYMPDYLALLGDVADNIPGVPGIGEKTALSLVAEYKTLENIIEHVEKLKPSHKKSLSENKETALMSRELNRLKFDVPITSEMLSAQKPDYKSAFELAERLAMRQICNMIKISEMR